jgi:YbbR domain-containing protein
MGELRGTLKRNWPYMITATLISVFLWVAVSADTVEQRLIDTDVVFIIGDPHYVMTRQDPPVDLVSVVFTGRAGDLAGVAASRPQIFVSIDSVEAPLIEIELEPEMVKGRGGRELVDVRAVSVRPSQFRLSFEERARQVVRVVPRLDVSFANGFMLADAPRAEPGAVAVEGPASIIRGIDSVVTVPVVRERLRETISVEVPLERPLDEALIELSSPRVRVTVPVEPRLDRSFPGIPLGIAGAPASGLRVEPSLIDVAISGPRSLVEAVRPEALLPQVTISGPEDYGVLRPITLPALGPHVTVTLVPDSARVVREGGPN